MQTTCLHVILLFSFSFLLLFTSCQDQLITENDITQFEDTIPPEISVFTPEDNGFYSTDVLVQGRVTDLAKKNGKTGRVESLEYQVIGTVRGDNINFDDNGFFSFSFFSGDFEGEKTLMLISQDWNRNTGTLHITLNKGAFRSLTCTPGNKEILLNWDLSPHIQSYTLLYTDNGTTPTTSNSITVDDISPPYTMTELTNGLLYSILMRGNTGGDVDDLSEVKQTIPLSSFTLAPRVTGEYGYISVSWNGTPGPESYVILRSTSKTGSYTSLPGLHTNTTYNDTDITPGQIYYYKIKPSLPGCIESEAVYGEAIPFPPFGSETGLAETEGHFFNVEVNGSYAYVADYSNGLVIVDISDPAYPHIIENPCEIPGNAYDVAVKGSFAYVAADDAGLNIINISNPLEPELIYTFPTQGNASAVEVKDSCVYVAAEGFGLEVIDVSVPEDPQQTGELPFTALAHGITIEENRAYIAAGSDGLLVVDISIPSLPLAVGSYDTPHMAYDVAIQDTYAYVADDTSGVQIYDISNISNITPVGSCDVPGTGGARGIAVSGMYAYVANDTDGVYIINISNPSQPVGTVFIDSIACAKGITLHGQYAYVAAFDEGLYILSSAEPCNPSPVSTINTSSGVMDIDLDGDTAYISASQQGLLMYAIFPGTSPSPINTYTPFGRVWNTTICGNYAFITGQNIGLEIVDISDPASCHYVSNCIIPDNTTGSILRGDYIYVSYYILYGESGIRIYDIADPGNPEYVTGYLTQDTARDIDVYGDYAFIADEDGGMYVINIQGHLSHPSTAVYTTNDNANGIRIKNNYAYIADGYAGIQIVDVSNPLAPAPSGAYNTPGFSYSTEKYGEYLFIADGLYGLYIIDARQPDQLLSGGGYTISGGETQAVIVRGSTAYTGSGNSVRIFDLWPYDEP